VDRERAETFLRLLAAMQALDVETADSILTDVELALARRREPAATACFMITGSFGQIEHKTARDHETPRRPPRRRGWHRAAARPEAKP
jgi:hypothetical protein